MFFSGLLLWEPLTPVWSLARWNLFLHVMLSLSLFSFKVQGEDGGTFRSRTGLNGFAIRCITALLTRHADKALP